jgi:hypothetical protein
MAFVELLNSPKELLTSMVYMGVKVTACNEIHGGVKASVATGIPH